MGVLALKENTVNDVLSDYSDKIKDAIQNIKREYFYIGALLNEMNYHKTYLDGGYNSIVEYCEDVFGFKKTFTYDLMKVSNKFRDPKGTMFSIDPRFSSYDFSKLVIMCNMNAEQLHVCNPEYSVNTLRSIKKGFFSSNDSVRTEKEVIENSARAECEQNEPYFVFDNYHVMDDIDIEAFKEYFGLNCSLGDEFRCVFYKL